MSVKVVSAAAAMWAVIAGGASAGFVTASQEAVLASANTASEYDSVHESGANSATSGENPETQRAVERSLADLSSGAHAFVLSAAQREHAISFTLPPNADTSEAWLRLAARPASDTTGGRIHVSVNNGDEITIRPQARSMEARFALFSGDLQAGENTLRIRYSNQSASAGWIVDARRSQLRLDLDTQRQLASLAELEDALAADFAAPLRVALIADDTRERVTMESLAAQAVALRAGTVPLFTGDAANSDLIIRIAEADLLDAADRAALRNGETANGPEIAFNTADGMRLIITGRNSDEAAAAARLFAARSFAGFDRSFIAADAIDAAPLGQGMARGARGLASDADLRTFATSGLPFSADQGSRTAVQFVTHNDADRFGALSVLARAALTGGEAWLYAWYGTADQTAPIDHDLLVIGPGSVRDDLIGASAPAELHAALRAAERSQGQRGLMRLAAAAYADEVYTETNNNGPAEIGVASLFEDSNNPGRWIGTLTAPVEAGFGGAGRSLARSDLWGALEGRAAVWSTRGVTSIDYRVAAPNLLDRAREFAFDHTRDLAFALFGLAFFVLIRGILRRRRKAETAA